MWTEVYPPVFFLEIRCYMATEAKVQNLDVIHPHGSQSPGESSSKSWLLSTALIKMFKMGGGCSK